MRTHPHAETSTLKIRITAAFKSNPWLWSLLILGLAGNLAGWLLLGALPDEAYYWTWSQHLQAGYYDHPPLIAWMIRTFTAIFGDSVWAMRLPSVVGWFASTSFAWIVARKIYGTERAAFLAALVWSSLPIVQAGFHVNTPDTPLVLFTWVTLYFALRALNEGTVWLWIVAGVCTGLALEGKYPGVLVAAGLFLGLALTQQGRAALATRGPWLGVLTAALVFAPVVIWNSQHEWISFAFQFHHGVASEKIGSQESFSRFMEFLGGQWGVILPWTWFAMAFASLPWRSQLNRISVPSFAILSMTFWLPLVFFGWASLTAKSQANWPETAYISGTVLLAGTLDGWLARGRRRAVVVGVSYLFGVIVINLLRFPQWLDALPLNLPPQRTQLSQTYGWEAVGAALHEMLAGRHDCVVLGDRLQTTAMLAFILDDVNRVAVTNDTRLNQFQLWQRERPIPASRLCLYFAQYDADEKIPDRVDLNTQGNWHLVKVIEHHNPDRTVRRSAFFLPVASATP